MHSALYATAVHAPSSITKLRRLFGAGLPAAAAFAASASSFFEVPSARFSARNVQTPGEESSASCST